tara:strand:- start:114 stop:458 length:345 start_codon:yes stop_codon:yes gene_type:complete
MRGLIVGTLLFALAQSMIWFQTNGQFVWPWFKKNPWTLSIVGGTTISYIFIIATRLIAENFDGAIWPGRFIGFTLGIISFTTLTYLFMGEGLTTKTLVCLALAFCILCVQVFWK